MLSEGGLAPEAMEPGADARLWAGILPGIRALPRQDSALLTVLSEADALLIRPVGDIARQPGTEVDYLPL